MTPTYLHGYGSKKHIAGDSDNGYALCGYRGEPIEILAKWATPGYVQLVENRPLCKFCERAHAKRSAS